jgi:hypothetical protein
MRRRRGRLLEIEEAILDVGIALKARGTTSFHGFSVAKMLHESDRSRRRPSTKCRIRENARLWRGP